MKTKKLSFEPFIYILFAVFYFWLAAQIPYTHDDWDWGLDVGMQQWLNASVNSRYVGNFFEIIMTRSVLLKTVIMGSAFFLLPYLLSHIAAKSPSPEYTKPLLFLAANFLLLTMSRLIWSETYGWVAGFANFGLSSVFTLLCFTQWSPLCETVYQPPKKNVLISLCWFCVSFFTQLFIENLSIVLAALSVFVCVVAYIRTKKVPLQYALMSLGMLLGLYVMFSSSVYDKLFTSGDAVDGLRQLTISSDTGFFGKLYNIFVQAARLATRAGEANYVLCISVLTILTLKLMITPKDNTVTKICIAINFIFAIYFTVNFILQTDYTPDRLYLSAFAAFVNALYFISVAAEAYILYRHTPSQLSKLLAVWFIGVALLIPLLVTTEAGYRLIFSLNIMVSLFVLHILQDILVSASYNRRILNVATLATSMIPVVVCIVVYSAIGSCNTERLERIEQASQRGVSEIILPAYPYENYLHAPDPIDEIRWGFYKEFYSIENDIHVIIEGAE